MNKQNKFVLFILILCVCAPFQAWAGARTLSRTEDYIVISGRDVMDVIGAEVSELRLYTCSKSGCKAAPLQVDKVDAAGRYVFTSDKRFDPSRDGTLLDPNDELCFMASEGGDTRPAGWKPEAATRGVQLELVDPLDKKRAWVYLFDEPGSSPPDLPDYVQYRINEQSTVVISPQYALGWKTGRIDYDLLRMKTGSGTLGEDVLDRQRVGIEAQLSNRNLPINTPENLIRSVDVAVIDGPVRVIIDQIVMVDLASVSFQWGTEYFIKYYRCGQNNSVFFSFPFNIDKMFKTMVFYWSLDFTQDVVGSKYYDPGHAKSLPIQNKVQDGISGDTPHYWWGMVGQQGTLIQALVLDDDIKPYIACNARWRQDSNAEDKNGNHPGKLEIGFSCREIGSLPGKKDFHWFNYILFPADPTAKGLKQLQNLIEHPLEINTKKVQ